MTVNNRAILIVAGLAGLLTNQTSGAYRSSVTLPLKVSTSFPSSIPVRRGSPRRGPQFCVDGSLPDSDGRSSFPV